MELTNPLSRRWLIVREALALTLTLGGLAVLPGSAPIAGAGTVVSTLNTVFAAGAGTLTVSLGAAGAAQLTGAGVLVPVLSALIITGAGTVTAALTLAAGPGTVTITTALAGRVTITTTLADSVTVGNAT